MSRYRCIHCGSDNIQSVKGIYESGLQNTSSSGQVRVRGGGISYNGEIGASYSSNSYSGKQEMRGVSQTALSQKLSPPTLFTYQKYYNNDPLLFLLISGVIFFFYLIISQIFAFAISSILSIFILAIVAIYFPIIKTWWLKQRREEQEEMLKVEKENRKIEFQNKKLISIWGNLYYCYRCDSVMDLNKGCYDRSDYLEDLVHHLLNNENAR